MPERVPATRDHFGGFADGPLRKTCRAFSVVEDERVLAIAGYYLENGCAVIFAGIKPEAKERAGYARAVLRYGRELMREVEALGVPVNAEADSKVEGSATLLKHLGFQPAYKEVWLWHGSR